MRRGSLLQWIVILVSCVLPALTVDAGRLTVDYTFERPEITIVRIGDLRYDRVTLEGATNGGPVGSPALPVAPARILLPLGTKVRTVEVFVDRVLLASDVLVEPVARPYRLMDGPGSADPIEPDRSIYDSFDRYPEKAFETVGVQSFRGFQVLVIRLQPVDYIPASRELYFSPNLHVVVETEETGRISTLFRGFQKDFDQIRRKIDNPEVLAGYEAAGNRGARAYDMMILTTDAFAGSFAALEAYHDGQGLATEIHTLTEVGSSDPAAVRDFIRDAYVDDGIEYVLIGGDDDVIPAQDLYVDSLADYVEEEMPGDLYFGCLDGTWDGDGDGRFGEPNDGADGADVDLMAEVFVGRCAAGSTAEVERFVTKTLWYMSGSHTTPAKVLLVGEHLGFGGVAEYAGATLEELEDGSSANGFTTVGIPTSEYQVTEMFERDMSWSQSTLATAINGGVHLLNHLGHGSPDYAMKFYNADVISELTNTDLLFLYSQTCLAGHFDGTDCWAETMNIKTDHGAFAVVMNARYGWGDENTTDGPSQRFNREFWDAVFGESTPEVGRANQDSKEDNLYRIGEPCMRWCTYELNLFGDPSLGIRGAQVTGMKVTPMAPFNVQGPLGGPFSPAAAVFTIENMNASDIDFAVSANEDWIDLSTTGGHLPAGGSTTVTVSINSGADFLVNGLYSDVIGFTNTTDHEGDTVRAVNLQVGEVTQQYFWDLSVDPGWTADGLWSYGTPSGSGGEYGNPDPSAGHTGSNVYGYNLDGDYSNGLSETHLTTAAFDCSGLQMVSVRFWRYLNVETSSYDHAYLRVSSDGSNWVDVWQNQSQVTDSDWTEVEYDLSDVADGQGSVYLRWTMGSTDSGWRFSGWNIDDIEILGLEAQEQPLFADGFEAGNTGRWSLAVP